jgi:ParB/RepB/Spo0J family partition protein
MSNELVPDIKAVENPIDKYQAQPVKMTEILSDPNFNCRGNIMPIEVIDLAKDIADRGLDQPIVVQPFTDPQNPAIKYRVVAGHRRHMAFKINNTEFIPAFVRVDLTDLQAKMLNLRENLHRQELNVKQEARALQFFLNYKTPSGDNLFTEAELADIFGQSRGWIQIRKLLLELPEDIQNEAAAGILTQDQIRLVAKIKNNKDRYELVRKIKDKKLRGEKISLTPSVQRASDVMKAKERKRPEIEEMNEILYTLIGPGLVTRVLAWSAGHISTVALYSTIQEYCEEQGIPFKMPSFINNALLGIKGVDEKQVAVGGNKT